MSDKEPQANSIQEKLAKILGPVLKSPTARDALSEVLRAEGFGLRRQVETTPWPDKDPVRLSFARKGIVLDTETTGFDPKANGVTQLSMMEFFYDDVGIFAVGEMFDKYNDPGEPIPQEITEITGITDEMVRGKAIDQAEIRSFIEGADRIIAHHASFDRRFVEENFPQAGFDGIVWDCSIEQVDWKARGFNSNKLEMIALAMGYVYEAHRADSDILATIRVLAEPGPDGMRSAFEEMLEKSEMEWAHIIALNSPFSGKDALKGAGYSWDGEGTNTRGLGKSWHIFLPATEENLEAQAQILREAYGRDVSLKTFIVDGHTRYSDRPATRYEMLRTAEPKSFLEALKMADLSGESPANMVQPSLL